MGEEVAHGEGCRATPLRQGTIVVGPIVGVPVRLAVAENDELLQTERAWILDRRLEPPQIPSFPFHSLPESGR